MQKILKILLAVGVVAFSVFMTATSCDKKDPSGGSGGSGGGGAGGGLSLSLLTDSRPSIVKIRGNTAVVNVAELSKTIIGSGSFSSGSLGRLFFIQSLGANSGPLANKSILYFVSRTHVTKDTITVKAVATAPCSTTESEANALAAAAGGGHCRQYDADGKKLLSTSYLGTLFNNTKTSTHARGALVLETGIFGSDRGEPKKGGVYSIISDATEFEQTQGSTVSLGVVTDTGVTATIDEAWVNDSASTTEVELYAIGIDIFGKTFEEFSGLKKADFDKEIDNATFKKMLEKNKWGELKFKIKIVNAADFAATR